MRAIVASTYRKAAVMAAENPRGPDSQLVRVCIDALCEVDPDQGRALRSEILTQQAVTGSEKVGRDLEQAMPLTGRRVAIAGGENHVRKNAARRLTALGAAEVIDIPPAYEQTLSEDDIRDPLQSANVVIEIWTQTQHQTSHAIKAAIRRIGGSLTLVSARGSGFSSIVAAALEWADNLGGPRQAMA